MIKRSFQRHHKTKQHSIVDKMSTIKSLCPFTLDYKVWKKGNTKLQSNLGRGRVARILYGNMYGFGGVLQNQVAYRDCLNT